MEAGSRVRVEWTDGKVYLGTVTGFHNGYYRVLWDGGESTAWVPPSALRSEAAAAPAASAPPAVSATPAVSAPPAAGWTGGAPEAVPAAVRPPAPVFDATAAAARGGKPISPGVDEIPRGLSYEPTGSGPGNGLAFHFLYALSPILSSDWGMRQVELGHLGDDVAALRAAGFRVYVDLLADADRLGAALRDEQPDGARASTAGIFWAGHGVADGSLVDWEGRVFGPAALSRVTAPPPALKLFVMSACYGGSSAATWKKVVGERAKILGWGAPVTAQRAADFLRQDEATSKGFDDFLKSDLGVVPVTKEGPLEDAVALGEALTKRLLGVVPTFERLIELAGTYTARKPVKLERDGSYHFLVPIVVDRPDGKKVSRAQNVFVMPKGDYVLVGSSIGPYSDIIDLARGLRASLQYSYARMIVTPPGKDGTSFMFIESWSSLRALRPPSLYNIIVGVGVLADLLEDIYFGADVR